MRPTLKLGVALLVLAAVKAWAAPQVVGLRVLDATVRRYGCCELAFALDKTYDNPFDPRQIAVTGHFRTPEGREVAMPGFFMQPYRHAHPDGLTISNPFLQRWEKDGPAGWRVRFCPTAVGDYTSFVTARDATGEGRSQAVTFRCTPSDAPGFVRVDERNPRYLRFDNGQPFIPLGLCVAWAHKHTPQDHYEHYLGRIAEVGGNTVRIFMCHWNWLEWSPWTGKNREGAIAHYAGAGRYNQMWAANFDRIFALCRRHGLRAMCPLCNGCEELGTRLRYEGWPGNPYNTANGGPCKEPRDLWTHPEARRLFKQRLRYFVARWGWSPTIFAHELWNEIGAESPASSAWHAEMTAYLHQIDPNRHLVSSSSWDQTPASHRATFAALDFSQLHYPYLGAVTAMLEAFPGKPLVIGEGGYGSSAPWAHERQTVHESLWQNFFLGAAGPPLTWHQTSRRGKAWHHPDDHFAPYPAIARFLRGVDPGRDKLVPRTYWAKADVARPPSARPVLVTPLLDKWLAKAPESRFDVPSTVGQAELPALATRLYGTGRDSSRNPPTFVAEFLAKGSFSVLLGEVASEATLQVHLDGKPAMRHQVSGKGRRLPPNEERIVSLPVPAGRHEIRVENAGGDWMKVCAYVLSHCRDARVCADLRVHALQGPRTALLWVRNICDSPLLRAAGTEPLAQRGCSATLRGLADGSYRIERWDTTAGQIIERGSVACSDGAIALPLPSIATDAAYKLFHEGPAPKSATRD